MPASDEQQQQCGFKTNKKKGKQRNREECVSVPQRSPRLSSAANSAVTAICRLYTRRIPPFTELFTGTDNLRCQNAYHGVAHNH